MEDINNENILLDEPNRIRIEQSGGFIDIIFFLLTPFIAVARFIIGLFFDLKDLLFSKNLIPIYTLYGETKFGAPEGEGYFWKYLGWCIKTGLYLVIFALGGIGFSLVGVLMVYKKLFSKFSVSSNTDHDITFSEKKKIEEDEMNEE
jgi:hypothetical protein